MTTQKIAVRIINETDPVQSRLVLTVVGNVPRVGDMIEGEVITYDTLTGRTTKYPPRKVVEVLWTLDLLRPVVTVK
jgi:hypothetical protein